MRFLVHPKLHAALPSPRGRARAPARRLAAFAAFRRRSRQSRHTPCRFRDHARALHCATLATSAGRRMKIACVGGGPAGLYFAISMKLRDPAPRDRDLRAQRARRDLRLGRRLLRPDGREPAGERSRIGADHRRANSRIGTISTSISAGRRSPRAGHGFIGIGRKRLLEILQDRARELGVVADFEAECDPADPKWRDYDLVIASDGANSRFRDADAGSLRRRRRRPRQQVRVARHVARCSTPSPSPSKRPSTAGSGRTPIASRPTARPSSSNVRKRPGARSASTGCRRTKASPPAKNCSPNISTATRCSPTPRTSSARPPGSTSGASSAIAGRAAMSSCSATPRTPRISRSARGPSSRSKTRSSSRRF